MADTSDLNEKDKLLKQLDFEKHSLSEMKGNLSNYKDSESESYRSILDKRRKLEEQEMVIFISLAFNVFLTSSLGAKRADNIF